MYRERTLQIAQGMQERNGIDEAVVHIEKFTCFR
jgi:hypothetical protein